MECNDIDVKIEYNLKMIMSIRYKSNSACDGHFFINPFRNLLWINPVIHILARVRNPKKRPICSEPVCMMWPQGENLVH